MWNFQREVTVAARTGVVKDPVFLEHDPGPYHPESPDRLRVLYEMLEEPDLGSGFILIPPRSATREDLERIHEPRYIERVAATAGRARSSLDPDTQTSPRSYEAALLAAGGCLEALDRIMDGEIRNAFAMIRPPGHHAESSRAMGFCLFNNVAVAAKYAQARHGLSRVMILDWDLHHGNGTQWAFYQDPTVFYGSTHQYPYYPGSGSFKETGKGDGVGYTLNVPLSVGYGDSEYLGIYRRIFAAVGRAFEPQLLIVSAGFDIYEGDPLGGMAVSPAGFGLLTRVLLEMAEEVCQGRVLVALEGGYNLEGLRAGGKAVLMELMGRARSPKDPAATEAPGKSRVDTLLKNVSEAHGEKWKGALLWE
jgi:acetoin utilization deacetylase AcuC-like enzyme